MNRQSDSSMIVTGSPFPSIDGGTPSSMSNGNGANGTHKPSQNGTRVAQVQSTQLDRQFDFESIDPLNESDLRRLAAFYRPEYEQLGKLSTDFITEHRGQAFVVWGDRLEVRRSISEAAALGYQLFGKSPFCVGTIDEDEIEGYVSLLIE